VTKSSSSPRYCRIIARRACERPFSHDYQFSIMTVPKLPAVSFADNAGYDSDEFDNDVQSNASSSASGLILGFDDGGLQTTTKQQQQQQQATQGILDDEANITVSRIGGRPVSCSYADKEPIGRMKKS
jgi:hypothetical protein